MDGEEMQQLALFSDPQAASAGNVARRRRNSMQFGDAVLEKLQRLPRCYREPLNESPMEHVCRENADDWLDGLRRS